MMKTLQLHPLIISQLMNYLDPKRGLNGTITKWVTKQRFCL